MLFNSYVFILGFLPAALVVFHGLRRKALHRTSLLALVMFSLAFYAWWNPVYLLLLIPLTVANFAIARQIAAMRSRNLRAARLLMLAGVAGNLGVLAYFKYANFLVSNVDALLGLDWALANVVLPLGISFFAFQKIAFLVDSYRGKVDRFDLLEFALFVSFFPQLIAGPIVHHSQVLPQFRQRTVQIAPMVAMGLTIFAIGLAKKVLLADTAATFVAPAFDAATWGLPLGMWSAWNGALAYTAQLYFDFSGYTDMAIGAALMFGIRLPLNFASPYKARNIAEFWRRWHMTLSRMLRDYLYIPLGGNRLGEPRRYVNLLTTMLLGGLWHGAAWTFVAWGALHGVYLAIHQAWQPLRRKLWPAASHAGSLETALAWLLTFVAVVVAWVIFRSHDLSSAATMLKAMAGWNGLGSDAPHSGGGNGLLEPTLTISVLLGIALAAPNTQQITGYAGPDGIGHSMPERQSPSRPLWRPSAGWATVCAGMFAIALMNLAKVSEFLYFQF